MRVVASGMKHYILTPYNLDLYTGNRYGVKDIDKWMNDRIPLFEKCANSILCHDLDFEWWILIDPNTPTEWKEKLIFDDRMKLVDLVGYPNKLKFPKGWKITTRIDSDDTYYKGALNQIQSRAKEEEMLIDIKYDINGSKLSQRKVPNSMFVSLVNKDPNKCVFQGNHSDMHKKYSGVIIKDKVLATRIEWGGNLMRKQGKNWIK
jgi:hypothetical protein